MTENDEEDDQTEVAMEILIESLRNRDFGLLKEVDAACVECADDAVWCSPVSDECYCEQHVKEFFRRRHG